MSKFFDLIKSYLIFIFFKGFIIIYIIQLIIIKIEIIKRNNLNKYFIFLNF
jgi:hypothetical protein